MHPGPPRDLPAALLVGEHPFTRAQALACGVSADQLKWLLRKGAIRRVLHGIYVDARAPESVALRAAALRLVVPPGAVVVDESAGWLHGATRIFAPSRGHAVPQLHVFHRSAGCRLRNGTTASGERELLDRDVMVIDGLPVTRPLRTACDLGRLRHRDQAMSAIDALLRLGAFSLDDLLGEVARFPGYRGVIQLRALAPLGDARSASPGESALRLRWYDAALPAPEPQYRVSGPHGEPWDLDLADPVVKYAAEYDGERHHTLPADKRHDEDRRWFLTECEGWTIDVLRRADVYGQRQQAGLILRRGHQIAGERHAGLV